MSNGGCVLAFFVLNVVVIPFSDFKKEVCSQGHRWGKSAREKEGYLPLGERFSVVKLVKKSLAVLDKVVLKWMVDGWFVSFSLSPRSLCLLPLPTH